MRNLILLIGLLFFGFAHAQTEKSFMTRSLYVSNDSTLSSFGSYRMFDKEMLSRLIPNGAKSTILTFSDNSFLQINQVPAPGNNFALDSGPFLGNATVQSFQLLNTEARSTYIFDMNGTLRSSQMSFSFGKKKI